MPNRQTKADAQNQQPRAGRPVATSFRFSPAAIRMLDALVGDYERREGEPISRAQLLRELIRQEWARRFPDMPVPTDGTGKGK